MDQALLPGRSRLDRAQVRAALAGQRAHCAGRSPFYVAVLDELLADPHAPWLARVEECWSARRFAVAWEAAHLLLACLHCSALADEDDGLAASYPSCGGYGEPDGAVAAFMARAPQAFWRRLTENFVQTNEVDRSTPWMLAASAFASRRLPFHLVEMGASAGLNLIGDHLPHACDFVGVSGQAERGPAGWNCRPHDVLTRAGLDIRPRRLAEREDRTWLRACVWADDLQRLERLDRAVQLFLRLAREPGGPQLHDCTFADAPAWLEAHRPPAAGEALLVCNAIGTVYLSDAEYARLCNDMARALAPWGDRATWVEYERPRRGEGALEMRVHRVLQGSLQTRVLASGEPRPVRLRLEPGWEFMYAR